MSVFVLYFCSIFQVRSHIFLLNFISCKALSDNQSAERKKKYEGIRTCHRKINKLMVVKEFKSSFISASGILNLCNSLPVQLFLLSRFLFELYYRFTTSAVNILDKIF